MKCHKNEKKLVSESVLSYNGQLKDGRYNNTVRLQNFEAEVKRRGMFYV
jgi:hypothetical protein